METSIDYAEVGLMAGLEVHQQLLTATKMFCRCPAGFYTENHDGSVLRHMRPTLSELGEYDGTALMEFKTKKNIICLLHKENVCTYEMDDTPPFLVNQEAVDIAIEQCLMLECDIVDEVHIARKQYLDGSIPTGFQRTAIVGVNGHLPFRGRELSITQVSVEEDSCREISDKGHLIVWRTDRLGMPLIETVTGPDLRAPDEVEEAILLIGRVCRSTGRVRVGMGASRQDVNVSVRGGRRVEIKGVPQAGWAPRLVHGEAVQQVNLLKLCDELHRRGMTGAGTVAIDSANVTDIFAPSELSFLRRERWERWLRDESRRPGFEQGSGRFCVRAIRLKDLAGTLTWPTQPDHVFATELAGRVRVIAGHDQRPIMLHSEKWRDSIRYAIESAEADAYTSDRGRVFRLALTRAMSSLRGRVPATEVVTALQDANRTTAVSSCRAACLRQRSTFPRTGNEGGGSARTCPHGAPTGKSRRFAQGPSAGRERPYAAAACPEPVRRSCHPAEPRVGRSDVRIPGNEEPLRYRMGGVFPSIERQS